MEFEMDNRILQMAFSVYNNPGVYAVLLGSGVSRSAQIPTGEEVIDDLIYKISVALNEEVAPDGLREWYENYFGDKAQYDVLLEALGTTILDRNGALRPYIEPTDEDLEQGRKVPTPAHKAIAWLVKHGYIRVALTTNFDRLLETAFAEIGVVPDAIITEDSLADSLVNLQHSRITLIKLHGDYLGRTKNVSEELGSYTDDIKKLLHRIFNEFGLIVCGWSGAVDTELKNAIYGPIKSDTAHIGFPTGNLKTLPRP
jgi:hypothetical protein